jgi:hypothetical protein
MQLYQHVQLNISVSDVPEHSLNVHDFSAFNRFGVHGAEHFIGDGSVN